MAFDRDEMLISGALDALEREMPVPDLMPGVKKKLGARYKRRRPVRFVLILAAAAALLSITAAAALGGLDWLRAAGVRIPFASVVEPVEVSAEDEGVKATVIAAERYGETGIFYISLEDTEGLGRITQDAVPRFQSSVSGDVLNVNCEQIYFDAETGRAVYEVRAAINDSMEGNSIPLRLRGIVYGREAYAATEMDLDLAQEAEHGADNLTLGRLADIPDTEAWVAALGVDGGELTVLYGQPQVFSASGRMYYLKPYLIDSEGVRIECESSSSGFMTDREFHRVESLDDMDKIAWSISAYHIDTGGANLEEYTLGFEGYSQEIIRGIWDMTVDFDNAPDMLRLTGDVTGDGFRLDGAEITISPIGVTVRCENAEFTDGYGLGTVILDTDEGEVRIIEGMGKGAGASYDAYIYSSEPIDVGSVNAIQIGDTRIEVPERDKE